MQSFHVSFFPHLLHHTACLQGIWQILTFISQHKRQQETKLYLWKYFCLNARNICCLGINFQFFMKQKLENSITAMQERGMQSDPRWVEQSLETRSCVLYLQILHCLLLVINFLKYISLGTVRQKPSTSLWLTRGIDFRAGQVLIHLVAHLAAHLEAHLAFPQVERGLPATSKTHNYSRFIFMFIICFES